MRPSALAYMTCAVGLGLLAGCPDRSISKVNPIQTGAETKIIPVSADLDLLFVIDNSLSTQDKQDLFTANFPQFVSALDNFPNGRPNLHIGVVTTTVGTNSDAINSGNCLKKAPNDDGLLVNTPRVMTGCQGPNGRFISDVASSPGGPRTTNYGTQTLAQAFSCIADVGTTGCGFESQLQAMKEALDGSQPQNAGFLRPGAYLGIIILTDEDDCSVKDPSIFALNNVGPSDFRCQPLYAYKCDTPISATNPGNYSNCKPATGGYLQDTSFYYNFLTSIKDPAQIVVAVIGGVDGSGKEPDPTGFNISTGPISSPFMQSLALVPQCMNNNITPASIGRPGLRLADFVNQFGSRGSYYSVCDSDFTPALTDIGNKLFNAISPCLEGPIDMTNFSAMATGQGLQCAVSDVQNFGQTGQTEKQIPPCTMQSGPNNIGTDVCSTGPCPSSSNMLPCWYVKQDATACPDNNASPTHLAVHVVRDMAPATGDNEVVSCAVSQM